MQFLSIGWLSFNVYKLVFFAFFIRIVVANLFEKENPTSSTLHILMLSSRCPTMDSLV